MNFICEYDGLDEFLKLEEIRWIFEWITLNPNETLVTWSTRNEIPQGILFSNC
ncbi:hypothetical protein Lalb_Chr05g0221781 [Lupinus albus]|uniref:Uncharacterized protein n=1 Tax=Lupinus albus TaxID=3870 RepID=A0A6A4QIS8_LUPAL|nr:hypothetical protein Lalb_Chr05g0221781 [Lupinus albus]